MNVNITLTQIIRQTWALWMAWALVCGLGAKSVAQTSLPNNAKAGTLLLQIKPTTPRSSSHLRATGWQRKLLRGLQNGAYFVIGVLLALIGFTELFKGKHTFSKIPLKPALFITSLCLGLFVLFAMSGCAASRQYGKKYRKAVKQQTKHCKSLFCQ